MFPYSAVYVHANRAALQQLSDHGYKTLQALITYADEIGICWPGIRTLVNDTGKCKEMVSQALEELAATGCMAFVRRNARDKYTGQKLVNIYQISPVLLHVRPELEDEAWKQWQKAKGKELSLSYTGQDRTNTRASDTLTSAMQDTIQHHHAAGGCSTNISLQDEADPTSLPAVEAAPPDRPARKSARRLPQPPPQESSAGRPQNTLRFKPMAQTYPEIEPIAQKLPNEADEALAQRIREDAQMPIKLARGLIAQYGSPAVEAAINHPFTQKAQRPAGYIRYLVQGNRLDPERDAKFFTEEEMDGRKYITGKYADFIEH